MCCYTKKLYRLSLLAGLLLSVQPVMAAEGENLIVAQNNTENDCTDMNDPKPCDGKHVPPVSKPSTASILQLTNSW